MSIRLLLAALPMAMLSGCSTEPFLYGGASNSPTETALIRVASVEERKDKSPFHAITEIDRITDPQANRLTFVRNSNPSGSIRVLPGTYTVYGTCGSSMYRNMFVEMITAETGKEYLFECTGKVGEMHLDVWSIPAK
jgi:hypothetical protein